MPPGAQKAEKPDRGDRAFWTSTGAGEEIRTLDPNLGKLTPPGAQKAEKPDRGDRAFWTSTGAGEEIRTLDPNLGKVVLYH